MPVTNIMPHIHFSDYDSFVLLLWPDQPDRYNLTPPPTGANTHFSVITNYYLPIVNTYQAGKGYDLVGAVSSAIASGGSQQVKVESSGAPSLQ